MSVAGNSTTRVHVWLHVSDYVPAGHRAKVTVMVTPLPAAGAASVSAQPKREVSFHFVVTDPGPGAAAAAAPVCVQDTRHVTSCGREACDALDPGKRRTAQQCLHQPVSVSPLSINTTAASAACEDYYWEAGFLVHDPSSGLNLAEVQWPEDAVITQSW